MIEKLRNFSTCELCDGMETPRVLPWEIKPQIGARRICGRAYPVLVPAGVSGLVPDAILAAEPGAVLVVAGGGVCNRSYWGDHRSICAKKKGLEAVVIDGAFRDVEGCREVGFPIFARCAIPCSAAKEALGSLNVPVTIGEVCVHPGDYIVGDESGVVVIRPDEAVAVMERSQKKIAAQNATISKMEETGEILPRVLKF